MLLQGILFLLPCIPSVSPSVLCWQSIQVSPLVGDKLLSLLYLCLFVALFPFMDCNRLVQVLYFFLSWAWQMILHVLDPSWKGLFLLPTLQWVQLFLLVLGRILINNLSYWWMIGPLFLDLGDGIWTIAVTLFCAGLCRFLHKSWLQCIYIVAFGSWASHYLLLLFLVGGWKPDHDLCDFYFSQLPWCHWLLLLNS